jgi:hypothetical protein
MNKEALMSNTTMIAEHILNVMQTLDEAHAASKQLIQDVDPENFDVFRKSMLELQERLGKIKKVLDNEYAYAMDELIDALNHAYTNHEIQYRRTPRMRA